ncbi:Heat shock 70 kDa protein 12A [Entomortierella beljakovae]|nr:Heat shock 70 kDa protein 12A [Entomortierella beljakovae]
MTLAEFDPDDYPIVVAIDFGTTFSPRQNIQYSKTPTLSLYEKSNGRHKLVDWGWKSKLKMETPAASKYVQLYKFKPYLDESVALTPWVNTVTIPTAISDYLGALHDYVAEKILSQFGPSFTRKSFRYCLTVPAIWSDKAKDIMRKAAIQAKLISQYDHSDRLMLVSEPEAAALYCQKTCKQYDLDHGDRFMICDAGGGTVDLIVYQIDTSQGGRKLSEVTKGHGATCGSMFIDLNLGNLLIKKICKQTRSVFPKNVIASLVETYAYQFKPQFDGEDDQYLPLPRDNFFDELDDPAAAGIDGGFMILTADELKEEVYEPVVKQVIELIDEQLTGAKECQAIFMVGGFGSSSYLLHRVKQEFGRKVRTISSPNKPEMAVVCGAVYAGLTPKIVTSRVTRRCYGTSIMLPFEEGVDPPGFKKARVDGVWCDNRFRTFVTKGQRVKVDECVTHGYSFTHIPGLKDFCITVYSVDGEPVRYSTDDGANKLAVVSIPTPFKSTDPIGHKVLFDTKMYFGLNEIKVDVLIQGKKHSTTLRFD